MLYVELYIWTRKNIRQLTYAKKTKYIVKHLQTVNKEYGNMQRKLLVNKYIFI